MDNPIVQLPIDLTGTNPNNLVSGEEHLLVNLDGFPYKIITLFHGGFYEKGLQVFDSTFNKLTPKKDYICTYKFKNLSDRTGRAVFDDIVFINTAITGIVYVSAQMVGGDLAYSFTAIQDYITWYKTKPAGYVPVWGDYNGYEPSWEPGELDQKRWGLDTYQPANNALEDIARAVLRGHINTEDDIRKQMRTHLDEFLAKFTNRLALHVNDLNNPHKTDAEKIGLGLTANLSVATEAEAIAITTNEKYLTPALAWAASNKLAREPLYRHIDINPGNPHNLTTAQLDVYTLLETEALLNTKHLKNTTVPNAINVKYKGAYIPYAQYVETLRNNLTTAMFLGQLDRSKMGTGALTATTVMRGDRRWSDVNDILAEYTGTDSPEVMTVLATGNNPVATKQTLDLTMPYKPLGSMAACKIVQEVGQGYGNGGEYYNIEVSYIYIMSPSGWQLV